MEEEEKEFVEVIEKYRTNIRKAQELLNAVPPDVQAIYDLFDDDETRRKFTRACEWICWDQLIGPISVKFNYELYNSLSEKEKEFARLHLYELSTTGREFEL